jgi:2-alkyl-3-oxoalkanoate reductase
MHALVTGGGGFLGLYITEQLVARGDSVRVFCRNRHEGLEELDVELVLGDVRDAATVEQTCRDIDVVFHTAAVPGIWGSWKMFHGVNTLGTENVIAACQKNRVGRLVHTSSPSVVFDGRNHIGIDERHPYPERYLCHYPHTKALAEKAVMAANGVADVATVILRPHLIWGPRDNHLIPRLIRRAQSGRLRRIGDGRNLISMIYVENAAAAHLQAADALSLDAPVAGRTYFVNEPEPVNLWGWVDDLLRQAGLPSLTKSLSPKTSYRIGAVMETIYRCLAIRSEPPMTRFLALQLSQSHCYDITRARRDFGFQPIVSVAEGMRRLAPDLRQLTEALD